MPRTPRAAVSVAVVIALTAGCGSAPGSGAPSITPSASEASRSPDGTATPPATATSQPTAAPVTPTASPITAVPGEPWIAYGSLEGRIRLVRPDGTDDSPLTAGVPGTQLHPDWSRDGERLAFAVDAPDGTRDLWVVSADGSSAEPAFDCADPCAWSDDPAWSPDDTRIAFQAGVGTGSGGAGVGEIRILDLGTGKVTSVYTAPAADYLYRPRWSPDGSALVVEVVTFASDRLDEERSVSRTIGRIDLATGAYVHLLPAGSGASRPDWHPRDDRIVFQMAVKSGGVDLHVIDGGQVEPTRITTYADRGGRAIHPGWAPDGMRIVFLAESSPGTPEIGVMNADGGTVTVVPNGPYGGGPRLRPTG